MSTQEQTQEVSTGQGTWSVTSKYAGRHYWVFPTRGHFGIAKWSRFHQYPATQKGLAKAELACQRYCDQLNSGSRVARNVFDRLAQRV